jgi:glycogen phosphorylase
LFRDGDPYFHLADFTSFVQTQERASHDFLNQSDWHRRAILNVANMGRFSSDRTIQEYAKEIWGI